jgi:subtilisin family serine protease
MVAAVDDGCRVISMSLGGYDVLGQVWWTDPVTGEKFRLGNDVAPFLAYRRAVQYAESRGAIVVASAGNDALNAIRRNEVTAFLNEEYGQHGYTFVGATFKVPAGTAGVISVSATGPDDSLSSYSTYGPGFVDVAAPGGDFQRWPAPGWHLDMCLSTYADYDPAAGTVWLGYAFMAGTSMAAPKVSAVAALVAAQNPGFGPAQIKAAVIGSAEDLGQPGYDWYYGHGLVNAYRALGGQ